MHGSRTGSLPRPLSVIVFFVVGRTGEILHPLDREALHGVYGVPWPYPYGEGEITGALFGACHAGMGGVVERNGLTAGFGGAVDGVPPGEHCENP